jgi:hypothetical protein
MRRKDLFPEVHLPLKKGYVSVEELARELSHHKSSLFQPLCSFPLMRSFSRRGKITTLTNFPLLTTTLGASRRRLGGKPPRVTNASVLVDANRSAQAMRMLLLAHKGSLELTLSTQHKDMT